MITNYFWNKAISACKPTWSIGTSLTQILFWDTHGGKMIINIIIYIIITILNRIRIGKYADYVKQKSVFWFLFLFSYSCCDPPDLSWNPLLGTTEEAYTWAKWPREVMMSPSEGYYNGPWCTIVINYESHTYTPKPPSRLLASLPQ